MDFSIKDKCERCNSTEDLDGVIFPSLDENEQLSIIAATLCGKCRDNLNYAGGNESVH